MGFLSAKTKLSAIGLEIDAHEFRAVQLVQTAHGINTLAWAIFPRKVLGGFESRTALPEPDELRWASSILERRGFVGHLVSIASPTSACSSHVIELPPVDSGAPIEQLARIEVARARRCSPGEFELGYWSLPSRGRTQESLAVACPRTVIDQTMETFASGGFVIAGMDLMELAIQRGSQAGLATVENEINASLHIGWNSSLAVLSLGETVIYVRRIERGARSVWDLATERYRLSSEGADAIVDDMQSYEPTDASIKIRKELWSGFSTEIVSELDVAMTYVSHSYRSSPFGKIRLSGYAAANPAVIDRLDKVLGIDVVYAPPRAIVERANGESGDAAMEKVWSQACRLTAAFGLAARFDQ